MSTLPEPVYDEDLIAPFPWFGGKRMAAALVWDALGDTPNYVEPFAGSAAVLLARPHPPKVETINDADGFVANFWRALQSDPDAVAAHADWPVNENDLHARHAWLVGRRASLTARLEGNPSYYDAKIAGWWVWGCCAWIGSGWCAGDGPWNVVDGELVKVGSGINRQLPHLGDAGQGINRQLPHLGNAGQGERLHAYLVRLANRLRKVRVCSGDWSRVCGPSVTTKHGLTGVFLDPPYGEARTVGVYAIDSQSVQDAVRDWAVAHGDDPLFRIVLAGYDGEHEMPGSWRSIGWKGRGGFGSQGDGQGRENASRERLWLSPHCQQPNDQQTLPLWDTEAAS